MELRIVKQPEWLKYKDVLRELEPGWPSLKGKVVGPNSYQALIYLEQYLMARKASTIAYNAYHAPGLTQEERVRLNDEYWKVAYHRMNILDSLDSL